MAERLAHYDCPGVGVAVMEGGEIAWAAGYGAKEKDQPARVDAQTMFSGASISKPVTTLLALQMVDRGIFNLDTDVNRYLKSWQVPQNEFTARQPVTLRLLLSHRAGTTIHGFGSFPHDRPIPRAIDILSRDVEFAHGRMTHGVTVDKTPGGSVRYSGGGTTIVEQMLEDVSSRRFHDLARENIFEPLGMTRSTFEVPLPTRYRDNAAAGFEGGQVLPGKYVLVPAIGAGAIFTTPSDYARFMLACRNAWLGERGAILSQPLARQMMSPQGGEFGLGWELFGEGGQLRFGHGGSNDGYQCESTCYLEKGQGAVVMTNADSGLFFYWEVFYGVADLFGWDNFMLPVKQVRQIPESELTRYTGTYQIVTGVEAPELNIWAEDGRLKSEVKGMRGGAREMFMDQNGRFFNRMGPYETAVIYDAEGKASELVILRDGKTEIMRARRKSG